MSHVPLQLVLIQTLLSVLLHCSALNLCLCILYLSLPLSLSLCINTPLGMVGRGRTISQSLSRFKVLFLPSLLLCSTCCCLIKLFHFLSPPLFPLPNHKCLVGHRTSLCFLPANESACSHTHTLSLALTRKHICTAAGCLCGNSLLIIVTHFFYCLFHIVIQYP